MFSFKLFNIVFYINNIISVIILLSYILFLIPEFYKSNKDRGIHSLILAVMTIFLLILFYYLKIPWWISPIIIFMAGNGRKIMNFLSFKDKKYNFKNILVDSMGIGIVSIIYCLLIYF